MIDSDNVFLLRPARPDSAFTLGGDRPPPASTGGTERGFVLASIMHLEA